MNALNKQKLPRVHHMTDTRNIPCTLHTNQMNQQLGALKGTGYTNIGVSHPQSPKSSNFILGGLQPILSQYKQKVTTALQAGTRGLSAIISEPEGNCWLIYCWPGDQNTLRNSQALK